MANLKDIADAAGVSITTVSNVIHGNYRRVSEKKVEEIKQLITRFGYIPNQAAQTLARRGSRVVAVIAGGNENENIFLNPYNAAYFGALAMHLYQNNYYPLVRVSSDVKTIEQDIRGWNVAGVMFNGLFMRRLNQIHSLSGFPAIFTDGYCDLPEISQVRIDDAAGGRLAADYLIEMGHRCIGFIGTALKESEAEQARLNGFRSSLTAHGTALAEDWIFPAWTPERISSLFLSSHRPTAFFCSSDLAAVRMIQLLHSLGLRVPDDVSLVGFDDLPIAAISSPRLSTIAQNIDEKARLSVEMLLRHINNRMLPPEQIVLGVQLVRRDSVRQLSE